MRVQISGGEQFGRVAQDLIRLKASNVGKVWVAVRIVARRIEADVKRQMPVDTGRARASWGEIWIEDPMRLSIIQGSRVNYIAYLNQGHSQQAPAGFIDAIARKAQDDLADEVMRQLRG